MTTSQTFALLSRLSTLLLCVSFTGPLEQLLRLPLLRFTWDMVTFIDVEVVIVFPSSLNSVDPKLVNLMSLGMPRRLADDSSDRMRSLKSPLLASDVDMIWLMLCELLISVILEWLSVV